MAITASVAVLDTLAIIAANLPGLNTPVPIYGIVQSDTFIPLTIPSSWGEFSPRYETQMSDYPVEQGSFAVYNKVRRPITVSVMLIKTGSDLARATWLAAIQQMEADNPAQLYLLVSPQGIYLDYAISGLSYETRQDHGSNKLHLTIRFTQVPQIPSSAGLLTNVLEPKSGPVQQIGQVFTNAATAVQQSLINAQPFLLD